MYCNHCGQRIDDEAVICPKCGCKVNSSADSFDAPSGGFGVLGFFFPLIGFIIWLCIKDKTPLKAKSAGKGALIGLIVEVVLYIILIIASFSIVDIYLDYLLS